MTDIKLSRMERKARYDRMKHIRATHRSLPNKPGWIRMRGTIQICKIINHKVIPIGRVFTAGLKEIKGGKLRWRRTPHSLMLELGEGYSAIWDNMGRSKKGVMYWAKNVYGDGMVFFHAYSSRRSAAHFSGTFGNEPLPEELKDNPPIEEAMRRLKGAFHDVQRLNKSNVITCQEGVIEYE